MKKPDLDRLLRSAAGSPDESPVEPPFGFETRVVAAWGAAAPAEGDFADLSRFLRRAGVIACTVLLVASGATYRQYRVEASLAGVATNEYAIVDSAIQTEFSQ
jgi:hypothetical protein